MSQTDPTPAPQSMDPEFQSRYRAVSHAYQDGSLSFADALRQLEDLRDEAQKEQNLVQLGGVVGTIGILYYLRGNYQLSVQHTETALNLFEQVNDTDRVITCQINLGDAYRLMGNFTRARMYFHRAYQSALETDQRNQQAIALANEGQMWLSLRSYEKARSTLEQAAELASAPYATDDADQKTVELVRQRTLCEIHHALAQIALYNDQNMEAWNHAKSALEAASQTGQDSILGMANRIIGDVITVLDTVPDDEFDNTPDTYYNRSLEQFRSVKADGEVGKTLFAQGQSLAQRGKHKSARQLFQKAMVIFTKLGMTDEAGKAAEAQLDIY